MKKIGTIKMNTMEVYSPDDDKRLNYPPLFRLHIEFTDVDFERLKTLPQIIIEYEQKN